MRTFTRTTEQALLMAIVFAAGLLAQWQSAARADEEIQEERIVVISPDGDATAPLPQEGTRVVEGPTFWIGVGGQPVVDPALRTQLQLAADTGVVVQQVVPDSPAAKAGLQMHDIIIAVNGDAVHGMNELAQAVRNGGGQAVELKILRLAQEETITVTPEERPADLALPGDQPALPGLPGMPGLGGELGDLNQRLQGLLRDPNGAGMRAFGPGVMLRQRQGVNVPADVSVSITRQGDAPAQITIKRGEESWTVTEGDEESMKQLPQDVRPFVEQMLGQQGGGMNFNFDMHQLQELLPNQMQMFEANKAVQEAHQRAQEAAQQAQQRAAELRERAQANQDKLLQRMQELEQRLQQMQERLEEQPAPPAGEDPVDNQTT